MADIELLKRLAEHADKEVIRSHGWDGMVEDAGFLRSDEQYVKAANPAAVLALIAENERLRQIISDSATACGAAMSAECTVEFMGYLPAEIAGVLGQIRAELEQARKDADRYRWLRDNDQFDPSSQRPNVRYAAENYAGGMFDGAIDAEMNSGERTDG